MFENTTVTLPLSDFDDLRMSGENYRRMATWLSNCFDYECVKHDNPEPPPLYTETLTVDIEQLIQVAKKYALYGKDVETELDAITVTVKCGAAEA